MSLVGWLQLLQPCDGCSSCTHAAGSPALPNPRAINPQSEPLHEPQMPPYMRLGYLATSGAVSDGSSTSRRSSRQVVTATVSRKRASSTLEFTPRGCTGDGASPAASKTPDVFSVMIKTNSSNSMVCQPPVPRPCQHLPLSAATLPLPGELQGVACLASRCHESGAAEL